MGDTIFSFSRRQPKPVPKTIRRDGLPTVRGLNQSVPIGTTAAIIPNAQYPTGNVTAAASVLSSQKIRRMRGAPVVSTEQWQQAAWHYFDITPELAYVTRFEAAIMSRAVLVAGKLPDRPGGNIEIIEDDSHPAAMAMSSFLGGRVNQSQEMIQWDTQLSVPGISYIVMWDAGPDSPQNWAVLSSDEISIQGSNYRLRIDGEEIVKGINNVLVIRSWNQDPRMRWNATSPVKHLLPILGELEGLTKHVSATIDSRLAGAGLLPLPLEMEFPKTDEAPEGVDQFTYEFVKYATTPISDRDVAGAVVPMVIRIPGEYIDKIKPVKFDTALDPQITKLREEAIRRVALGLDQPPEVLLGMADANHWTSWQIEESSIKLHIEPKLQTVCHAITNGYLQASLKAQGVEDWYRYLAWYDITQVKLRPNRASDAKDLHDDLLIKDEVYIKASGFDVADRPNDEEYRDMLFRKILTDAPQLAEKILPLLGIEVPSIQIVGDPSTGINNNPTNESDSPTPNTRPGVNTENDSEETSTEPGRS